MIGVGRSTGLLSRVALAAAIVCLSVLVAGCGGGELSLTEYVDEVNDIVTDARADYEELLSGPEGDLIMAEGEALLAYTPEDLGRLLERIGELGEDVLDEARALEPPAQVEDLHDTWFEVDDRSFTDAQAALAERARTAADWYELSDSPEMAAYRAALRADKEACGEFQATLDATEARGVFADTPWIPGELQEIVDVFLGCEGYPDNPDDVYRPAAVSP